MVIWLTGQPGAGKTVLGDLLKQTLESKNLKCFRVDGDNLRELTVNKDYSREGRVKNIEKAQTIAHYLHNLGTVAIVSLVAPYLDVRNQLKEQLEGDFYEIYLHTSDIRGREHFHSKEYEKPVEDFLSLDTTEDTPEQSLDKILHYIGMDIQTKEGVKAVADKESSSSLVKYSAFFGRWQPWHKGHRWLIDQRLKEGKNVWVAIRDVTPCDKNPYTAEQVMENLNKELADLIAEGRVVLSIVPDIESLNYGRGVGYDVIEHVPPKDIHDISASKIREKMRKEGKL